MNCPGCNSVTLIGTVGYNGIDYNKTAAKLPKKKEETSFKGQEPIWGICKSMIHEKTEKEEDCNKSEH